MKLSLTRTGIARPTPAPQDDLLAIGQYAARGKDYLVALRPYEGRLLIDLMEALKASVAAKGKKVKPPVPRRAPALRKAG